MMSSAMTLSTSAPSDSAIAGLMPGAAAASASAGLQSSAPVLFGHLIPVKLSAANHLLWRAQVVGLLRSNLLHGYVEGTYPCPPAMVTVDNESRPNPLFAAWIQQDQAILTSFLTSSMPEVGSMFMLCKTSAEAWTAIERMFASKSCARAS